MSKESRENGLHQVYHGGKEEQRAKAEGAPRRGTFAPDSQDWARLREGLHGAARRMT